MDGASMSGRRASGCFHNPDRSPTAYWTIRRSYLWSDSVEEEFSPAGETGANGELMKRSRIQRWQFDDVEELRRWYAAEVARRLSKGISSFFASPPTSPNWATIPRFFPESVDPVSWCPMVTRSRNPQAALWMEHHRRASWKPVTVAGDGPGTASKFSRAFPGSIAEDWPECPTCRVPMQLLVQLALDTLPPEIGPSLGEGLLQFFACLRSECELTDENFLKPYPKIKSAESSARRDRGGR